MVQQEDVKHPKAVTFRSTFTFQLRLEIRPEGQLKIQKNVCEVVGRVEEVFKSDKCIFQIFHLLPAYVKLWKGALIFTKKKSCAVHLN